jgi:PAS domain S-box-containing protein
MSEVAVESSVVVDLNEKVRVLHVDDDSALLKISKQCLEIEAPVQIDTAMSVDEASAKLEKEKYDVVVSDYQMPGKDGLEFLKELREKGNTIPFIIFTGKGREEVAIKALNLGASQYLNKTGDPETVYCELAHAITEVAERKRAREEKNRVERALREASEKYEQLFNSALDGILINGPDGNISSLNPAAARMLGYDNREELIGKPAVQLYADPEVRSQVLKELTAEGSLQDCELLWKKKDGTLIEILANITLQKDEKGNLLRTEGIVRDVTDKKKAERALVESEQKLRSVVYGSPIPAFYINRNHKVVYWNGALEKYSGIKAEEIVGTDQHWRAFYPQKRPCMADLVLGDDTDSIATLYPGKYRKSDLVEGGYEATDFFPKLGKNGAWLYFTAVGIRDSRGSLVGALEMLEDITERKKAEEALQDSEARFRELADRLPEMVLEIDAGGRVIFINKRGLELTGYSEDDFKGGFDANLFVAPEDLERSKENMKEMFSGEMRQSNEYTFIKKNGTRYPVSLSSGPIVKDGKIVGARGIIVDISGRKKAEEALRTSEEKYRAIFENEFDFVTYVDINGRILDVNDRVEGLLGFKREEIVGKRFEEIGLVDSNRLPELLRFFDESVQRGIIQGIIEIELIRKNGEKVPVEVGTRFIRDSAGRVTGTINTFRDITERKRAEIALFESSRTLNESQMLMNAIFNSTNDLIWSVSADDFRLLTFNKATSDYFLRTQNLTLKTGMNSRDIMPTEQLAQKWLELNKRALREGSFTLEYTTLKEPRVLELKFNLLKHDEKPFAIAVFGKDITEQRKEEERVKSQNKARAQ